MSRLAEVHTGHPTQGAGTVPNGKAKAVHASPLQAQRAEAEASGALLLDDLADLVTSPPSAPSSPSATPSGPVSARDPYSSVRAAATAAWLSLTATELEVRKYFRSLPVQSGLEILAKMRKQCDLAAGELQNRIDEGLTERCTGCNKTLEEARKSHWIKQGADTDPATGVPVPYRFCGALCVRERNRDKMLPKDSPRYRFDGQEEGDVR